MIGPALMPIIGGAIVYYGLGYYNCPMTKLGNRVTSRTAPDRDAGGRGCVQGNQNKNEAQNRLIAWPSPRSMFDFPEL